LDAAKGALGAPMADQTEAGDVITQRFSGGVVSWDHAKNEFSTEPANLASDLSGVEVPGQQESPDAPSAPQSSDSDGKSWLKFSWWWLLALVPVVILVGAVLLAIVLRRGKGEDPFAPDGSYAMDDGRFGHDPEHPYGTGGSADRVSTDDEYAAAMFGDRYASAGLGSQPHDVDVPHDLPHGDDEPPHDDDRSHVEDWLRSDEAHVADDNVWGAPPPDADEEPPALFDEPDDSDELVEDDDAVDTAPTAVITVPPAVARDPLTDTGRHARIEIDDPEPRIAFLMALEDPNEAPEGYPVKANTKTGVYWAPGSVMYDDASAEIWFASEELAQVNGFVSDDELR